MPKHALPDVDTISKESVALYALHRQEALLLLNDFLLKYLNSLYKEFDGDIVLAIVLGELAHQNITHILNQLNRNGQTIKLANIASIRTRLVPCNPLSISEGTGIPRETVRRKFAALLKLGWIERISHNGYIITDLVSERFRHGFNLQLFEETLHLCSRLHEIMHRHQQHEFTSKRECMLEESD